MSPTETQNPPAAETRTLPPRVERPALTTYRIEIENTGRVLLQGFHIEIRFTDSPNTDPRVAEFGDPEIAFMVIRSLNYAAPLLVKATEWDLEGGALQRLCRRVADTGASANMRFWGPASLEARAHMGIPNWKGSR